MIQFQKIIRYFIFIFLLIAQLHSAAWSADFTAFDHFLFSKNEFGERDGTRTDGILVEKDGRVIFEKYARGYDGNKKHIMWSISKTIVALMFGVAYKEQKFKLDQSICDFIQVPNNAFCKITIQHVLQWSTGIKWLEDYERTAVPKRASILAMLYGEGRFNMAKFVLEQPLIKEFLPGEAWRYSSGDTILAAYILKMIYKGQDLRKIFAEKLFNPLGVKDWLWESDNSGTLGGAFYFYTSVNGLTQIGRMILNGGQWQGHVIIPKDYLDFMVKMPESYKKHPLDLDVEEDKHLPGAHIWINDPSGTNHEKSWPTAPIDSLAARGHWGQILLVIPSQKLVAVRLGDTRDESMKTEIFVKELVKDILVEESQGK